jgi:hypothetical protein
LPILRRHVVDNSLAVEIARRILAACPEAPSLVAPTEAPDALARAGGNMREALFRLYDLYEDRWGTVA